MLDNASSKKNKMLLKLKKINERERVRERENKGLIFELLQTNGSSYLSW